MDAAARSMIRTSGWACSRVRTAAIESAINSPARSAKSATVVLPEVTVTCRRCVR